MVLVIVEEVKVYLVMERGVFGRLKSTFQTSIFATRYIFSIADFLVPYMFTAISYKQCSPFWKLQLRNDHWRIS